MQMVRISRFLIVFDILRTELSYLSSVLFSDPTEIFLQRQFLPECNPFPPNSQISNRKRPFQSHETRRQDREQAATSQLYNAAKTTPKYSFDAILYWRFAAEHVAERALEDPPFPLQGFIAQRLNLHKYHLNN